METKVDIENWDRKESYLFFKDFKDPFVGITVELDATSIWEFSRANSLSIHHALLYCTLSAANKYLPMRLRRQGDGVVVPYIRLVRSGLGSNGRPAAAFLVISLERWIKSNIDSCEFHG